jgi:hypothetical protein
VDFTCARIALVGQAFYILLKVQLKLPLMGASTQRFVEGAYEYA